MSRSTLAPSDSIWMKLALSRARKAAKRGEVPVGCVIVREGVLLATGSNRREAANDPTAHAEIVALRRAGRHQKDWRLDGATLYVTLEPCLMCLGALKNARVARLVYGAKDPKQGATELFTRRPRAARDGNDRPLEILGGVLAKESAALLKDFFSRRRKARED